MGGQKRATVRGQWPARLFWAVGAAVLLVFLAGPAGIAGEAGSAATPPAELKVVKTEFFVANNTVRNSVATCPAGTKVLSGGFASTGVHAKVFVAGPSRGENGYVVHAYTPPVNITTGVGKELARITIVAYCAPVGKPLVLK